MRLSLFAHLITLAALTFVTSAVSVQHGRSPSSQLADLFDEIAQDVKALSYSNGSSNIAKPGVLAGAEVGLVKLGKSLDTATQAAKKFDGGYINKHNTGRIALDLYNSVIVIKNVTEAIRATKSFSDKAGYSGWITKVLQGLEAQFAQLSEAIGPHLHKKDRKAISAMFVTIICLMDDVGDYLTPSAALTDDKYCNHYGTSHKSSYSDYQTCNDKHAPKLPKTPIGFADCNKSCTNYFAFGYENQCTTSFKACQSVTWCKQPFQSVSPTDWTLPKPYCNKTLSSP